jgi:hypothetical protein
MNEHAAEALYRLTECLIDADRSNPVRSDGSLNLIQERANCIITYILLAAQQNARTLLSGYLPTDLTRSEFPRYVSLGDRQKIITYGELVCGDIIKTHSMAQNDPLLVWRQVVGLVPGPDGEMDVYMGGTGGSPLDAKGLGANASDPVAVLDQSTEAKEPK